MGPDIMTKVIAAIAATLVAELAAKALDWIGLTEEVAKLPREIIKAVAAAIAALLTEDILGGSDLVAMSVPLSEDGAVPTADVLVGLERAA
jgi:hypothetical protein